jgi:hypothetical protein
MNDIPKKPAGREEMTETRRALEAAFEPHFKIWQLAERWGWSENYLYALFVDEPGVIKPPAKAKNKRVRISLRVPLSVANRVYERLKNKAS